LEVHQAFDHFDGVFLGVISVRGEVIERRLLVNHDVMSLSICGCTNLIFWRKGVRIGHGVSSKLGEDLAVSLEAGVISIWITV
jgi:hypothetical protein